MLVMKKNTIASIRKHLRKSAILLYINTALVRTRPTSLRVTARSDVTAFGKRILVLETTRALRHGLIILKLVEILHVTFF